MPCLVVSRDANEWWYRSRRWDTCCRWISAHGFGHKKCRYLALEHLTAFAGLEFWTSHSIYHVLNVCTCSRWSRSDRRAYYLDKHGILSHSHSRREAAQWDLEALHISQGRPSPTVRCAPLTARRSRRTASRFLGLEIGDFCPDSATSPTAQRTGSLPAGCGEGSKGRSCTTRRRGGSWRP